MMKQCNLFKTTYSRMCNLFDEVEIVYYSIKNKNFILSGNIEDTIIYVHCLETASHVLYVVICIGDIDMEFDLYDSDDLEECIEDIMSVIR